MVWPSSFFLISSQVAAQVYTPEWMLTKWLHPSLLIAPGLAFFWTISSDLAGLQCHSWFFNTLSTLASEELEPILKKLVLLNFDVNTNIKCISTQITWKLCCFFFFLECSCMWNCHSHALKTRVVEKCTPWAEIWKGTFCTVSKMQSQMPIYALFQKPNFLNNANPGANFSASSAKLQA